MEFGWINLFGGVLVLLMLIPNIVYALKNREEQNLCTNRLMNLAEQVGRYGCIVLMWLPLLVWKFGFWGKAGQTNSVMTVGEKGGTGILENPHFDAGAVGETERDYLDYLRGGVH